MRQILLVSICLVLSLPLATADSSLPPSAPPVSLKFQKGAGPIIVKGEVGGEEHDSYSVQLQSGTHVRVSISSTKDRAGFWIGASDQFFDGERVRFGSWSKDKKVWNALIPKAETYYIFLTAYPEAKYTLTIRESKAKHL